MSDAGLQVFNDTGNIQIDSNYRNQKLLWYGTAPAARYGNFLSLSGIIDPLVECPLVFVRTTGVFAGFDIRKAYFTIEPPQIVYHSTAPVEFAIFSVSAPDVSSNVGLQIFDASGRMVYSSANKYVRIQEIAAFNGSATIGTFNFTSWGERPWICANPIVPSLEAPLASGSDISVSPYMVSVTYTNNSMTYRFVENGDAASTSRPSNASLSQYNGRTLQIPMGVLPGY